MVKSLLDAEEAPLTPSQGSGQRDQAALQDWIPFEDERGWKRKILGKHDIFDLSKRLISCSDTCA